MSRSLYARLHRRFGQRDSGITKATRIELKLSALANFTSNLQSNALQGKNVVIVGGGFAGLSAGCQLAQLGASVTVLEAQATVGGRVLSNSTFIEGLIIEFGAELIGSNHASWLAYARQFGLAMSVITQEDNYVAESLQLQMYLNEAPILPEQQQQLYEQMQQVYAQICTDASPIDAYNPWLSPDAQALDSITVDSKLEQYCGSNATLLGLMRLDLENNQTVATTQQSYLGLLATVKGGGLEKYWEDTEVFRCGSGNQQLASCLSEAISSISNCHVRTGQTVTSIDDSSGTATVYTKQGATYSADYVIIAVSPAVWADISLPFAPPKVSTGPAVKFLSNVKSRFWIQGGEAPSSVSDIAAMTWEGSDNQIIQIDSELSVFAGGQYATMIETDTGQQQLKKSLNTIYPGYSGNLANSQLQDWPSQQYIMTGYSCPAPTDVCIVIEQLNSVQAGNILFAGEHVSTCFFGYMEGALESGIIAAQKVALLANSSKSATVGGNYATYPFDGLSDLTSGVTGVARLAQVTINSGDIVDGITPTYQITNLDGSVSQLMPAYGGSGGGASTFVIPEGDALATLSGYFGQWYGWTVIEQLTLTTRGGQKQTFGTMNNVTSSQEFTFSAPAGQQIIGFFGNAVEVPRSQGGNTNVVCSLGVVYGLTVASVASVVLGGSGPDTSITVNGSGFPPPTTLIDGEVTPVTTFPFTGVVNEFAFQDVTHGWSAGWTNPPHPSHPNTVTVQYTSWSSTQITTTGFAGDYGQQYGFVVQPGDSVEVCIYDSAGNQLACASTTVPG